MARGGKRGKKKKAEVIPALSLACVTYLRHCVLWEPATEFIRRPQRARESRSECERGSGGIRGRRRAASNLCSLSSAGEQESTGGHGDMGGGTRGGPGRPDQTACSHQSAAALSAAAGAPRWDDSGRGLGRGGGATSSEVTSSGSSGQRVIGDVTGRRGVKQGAAWP